MRSTPGGVVVLLGIALVTAAYVLHGPTLLVIIGFGLAIIGFAMIGR